MASVLDRIKQPNDIKKIKPEEYPQLAAEIRRELIRSVSTTGGHLASNLGVVELTMALHICLDLPQDKLIWDVGHQSYVHKMLTGRRADMASLRSFGGMSGFPKHKESPCDAFDTGHSSTSISAALGYAAARDLAGEDYTVAAVIGDGSLTGGMAIEALNNVSRLKSNLIIILNDNKMSISENVGGLPSHLNSLRTQESYMDFKQDVKERLRRIPKVGDSIARGAKASKDSLRHMLVRDGIFGDYGIRYVGPVSGHDTAELVRIIRSLKKADAPVVLHVVTRKGMGYKPAEQDPTLFHGIGKFDIKTGRPLPSAGKSWTKIFSETLMDLASEDDRLTAICAAMPEGTGLAPFAQKYPDRFFDVGIAEQHAVTFAAGLAAGGSHPFVAIYSSFFQRAYDQIIHDVCLQQLPVTLCVDRAGLVGADGETHQGIFDLSYLSMIPGMTVCAPMDGYELAAMLRFAHDYDGPIAVRYPRGSAWMGDGHEAAPIVPGRSELLYRGRGVALLAIGSMVETALQVRAQLLPQGIDATVVNARFVRPLDETMLADLAEDHDLIVTLEENVLSGGFGEHCTGAAARMGLQVRVMNIAIPDVYVEHGDVARLREMLGMDADSITARILTQMP